MDALVRNQLKCANCTLRLQRPLTLHCGHSVCAAHPACNACPPAPTAHHVLPSGVGFYAPAQVHSQYPRNASDIALANIIDLPHAPDFAQRLLSVLTCHVCFQLVVEPVTTPCQHTFCADCLERALDHHLACPLCRQPLPASSYLTNHPRNAIVQSICSLAFHDLHAERKLSVAASQHHPLYPTPIFRCNLALPGIPTFLHVFEPRYRLMIRRCLASPEPQFGMVMQPQSPSGTQSPSQPQVNDGSAEYGTMLEIRSVQMFPDGRSMLETMGTSRFRLIEHGVLDGYHVGRIELIDDLQTEDDSFDGPADDLKVAPPIAGRLPTSTSELVQFCHDFLHNLRSSTAPWVAQKLDSTHGSPPDDPAAFSFWMASVLPIHEREKARLLPLRSPRARLVLIARWIDALVASSGTDAGCVVS